MLARHDGTTAIVARVKMEVLALTEQSIASCKLAQQNRASASLSSAPRLMKNVGLYLCTPLVALKPVLQVGLVAQRRESFEMLVRAFTTMTSEQGCYS